MKQVESRLTFCSPPISAGFRFLIVLKLMARIEQSAESFALRLEISVLYPNSSEGNDSESYHSRLAEVVWLYIEYYHNHLSRGIVSPNAPCKWKECVCDIVWTRLLSRRNFLIYVADQSEIARQSPTPALRHCYKDRLDVCSFISIHMLRLLLISLLFCSVMCSFCSHTASDGSFYDLSSLSELEFVTTDKHGDLFYFGICSNAPSCDNTNSVACSVSEYTLTTQLGFLDHPEWSEKYSDDGEGISLTYGGGEDCNGDFGKHDFTITMKCDPDTLHAVVDFDTSCGKSRAIIRSEYACPLYTNAVDISQVSTHPSSSDNEREVQFWWFVVSAVFGMLLAAVVSLVVILVVVSRKQKSNPYDALPAYEPDV